LLRNGDETADAGWRPVEEIQRAMEEEPRQFSDVDRGGIMYYLKHKFGLLQ